MRITGQCRVIPAVSLGKTEQRLSEQTSLMQKGDSLQISDDGKAFQAVDEFLNLGKSDRTDISSLSPDEKKEFFKMLGNLAQKGIVGYEVLKVNGVPEKHFIETEIGDKRLKGAKLYKKDE